MTATLSPQGVRDFYAFFFGSCIRAGTSEAPAFHNPGVRRFASSSSAALITNFESFQDGDHLTTQIPGLTFTNTTVATAGISLNELEFPPHSGVNAAFDDGGPITVAFATPIGEFDGYFDYSVPITLDAFNAANQILAYLLHTSRPI